MSLSPVLSIRRLAVQIVTTRPGRRVAPMPGGTQPDSSRDDSIMTPGDATLGAQEVKEDLPKPTDGRIMICAAPHGGALSLSSLTEATGQPSSRATGTPQPSGGSAYAGNVVSGVSAAPPRSETN
jgi:hypothetical protein